MILLTNCIFRTLNILDIIPENITRVIERLKITYVAYLFDEKMYLKVYI